MQLLPILRQAEEAAEFYAHLNPNAQVDIELLEQAITKLTDLLTVLNQLKTKITTK